ncbi:hypothetical protein [Brochothrix campestris]|uniref:Uncharacterized protein n=1 Tax=Brochothrix campestris FSL F6-1037 TaxID=1265861 RepID=W7CYP1_9LIST|nr:hypothetical protein [Brochothrix campestris]EUJ41865.1 hypothetical protein BCAMP_01745 [Brochothrix campestris FSL F6-1037]
MKKSTLKKYGQYHKCVFHIHTPASHDYTLIPGGTCSKTLIDYAMKIGFLRENFNEIEDFTYKGFKNQHECLSYLLLANKLVDEEIEIAVVTDHNCIDGFCKLADAIKNFKRKRRKDIKGFSTNNFGY